MEEEPKKTYTLVEVFPEVVDVQQEYPKQSKDLKVKTWIVRKHPLFVGYCVFKINDKWPFLCLHCFIKNPWNRCPHVSRVVIDYPMHPDPKFVPAHEEDAILLLKTMEQLEKELMTPVDKYIDTFYQEMCWEGYVGYEPEVKHEVITKEQKKLLDNEREIWAPIVSTFLQRECERFIFLRGLKNMTVHNHTLAAIKKSAEDHNVHLKKVYKEFECPEEEKKEDSEPFKYTQTVVCDPKWEFHGNVEDALFPEEREALRLIKEEENSVSTQVDEDESGSEDELPELEDMNLVDN